MKTLEQINEQINSLTNKLSNAGPYSTEKDKKQLKIEIKFFKYVKLYLETNPSQAYLETTLISIESKIDAIEKHRDFFFGRRNSRESRSKDSEYTSKVGLLQLREQQKMLKFLLS
jgi:hypothetical protein